MDGAKVLVRFGSNHRVPCRFFLRLYCNLVLQEGYLVLHLPFSKLTNGTKVTNLHVQNFDIMWEEEVPLQAYL